MNSNKIRSIAATVLAEIAPEADLAGVGDDEDLREALDLDSMDFMNFVVGLHQKTGRDIPQSDVPNLYTLAGVLRYFGSVGGS
jgi:acyl carrier protein